MSTRTAYYLVENGTYAPINIVPSDLIKCTHCNTYVPYNEIKSHTQIHIPPQYSVSLTQNHNQQQSAPSKLKILQIIKDDVFAHQPEDISVKSLLPEQMPSADNFRKQAVKISSHPHPTLKYHQNNADFKLSKLQGSGVPTNNNITNPDQLDVYSRFTQQYHSPQIHQDVTFKKQIDYSIYSHPINYKKIKTFQNRNSQKGIHVDQIKRLSKKSDAQLINLSTQGKSEEEDNYYRIEANKQNSNSKTPITVQIKSNKRCPIGKQKISTVSTSGSGFFKGAKLSNFFGNQSDSSQQTRNNVQIPKLHMGNKYECNSCKGFYCKQCGSDIPPMYRPVPNNLSQCDCQNQEIKSYYASHVYSHKNGKTSRVTRCTNCD